MDLIMVLLLLVRMELSSYSSAINFFEASITYMNVSPTTILASTAYSLITILVWIG